MNGEQYKAYKRDLLAGKLTPLFETKTATAEPEHKEEPAAPASTTTTGAILKPGKVEGRNAMKMTGEEYAKERAALLGQLG